MVEYTFLVVLPTSGWKTTNKVLINVIEVVILHRSDFNRGFVKLFYQSQHDFRPQEFIFYLTIHVLAM